MINELYELSKTLDNANIKAQNWHRKYKPIPNITAKSPCICIKVSDGKVVDISSIDKQVGSILRKYGSNQGSFPCMNLAPLYRVTDDLTKKTLSELIKNPESLDDEVIEKIKNWCSENNWTTKFQKKYTISMINTVAELRSLAVQYEPLQVLMNESEYFTDSTYLHAELEKTVWSMLEQRKNVSLALTILIYHGKKDDDGYGSLSVALESSKLIELGIPAISQKFVTELNRHLLDADNSSRSENNSDAIDAFGIQFMTIEKPMPSVKLTGGFDVTIRTMFKDQKCQTRYGKIENASYPVSPEMRMKLQGALEWIASSEQKNKTWITIAKNEIMFVYPSALPKTDVSCTNMFHCPAKDDISFNTQAKIFIQELNHTREFGTDSHADEIKIFILRKIDKARTKVIYTRQTDAYELEKCSEAWTAGCKNLPKFPFGAPRVLYPLEAADVLNTFWKQNGEKASDSFKPTPKYHGLELLLEPDLPVTADLHVLSEKAMTLGAFLGKLYATEEYQDKSSETKKFCSTKWNETKDILALIGLLLYRKNIRKDDYMENLPYLYGQLFKACDELHALYCKVVRNGDIPPQLAGGSLFQSADEMPVRTLNVLQQRIMPYYLWAKSYRLKDIQEPGKESWRAAWLYHLCERIMTKLENNWNTQTRFNDEEKAQLFIGYLAAFSKKEQSEMNSKEETTNG